MNSCRISLLDSYVGEDAVLSWLQKRSGQHATARGYVPPTAQLKADSSSPWARQWCAGPVNGTWSTRMDGWLWTVVWWFLLNLFCVWKMVLGLLVANSFFMYAHSFTWNRFHSFISTSFFVLWLKSIVASWCNGSFMRCTARYVCWWDEPTRALTSDSW